MQAISCKGKKHYIEFDQASFVNVEVIPFIEEEVVVIDIPNFWSWYYLNMNKCNLWCS